MVGFLCRLHAVSMTLLHMNGHYLTRPKQCNVVLAKDYVVLMYLHYAIIGYVDSSQMNTCIQMIIHH